MHPPRALLPALFAATLGALTCGDTAPADAQYIVIYAGGSPAPVTLGSLPGLVLWLDARKQSGSLGASLPTLTDFSSGGNSFTQSSAPAQPTLAAWQGGRAFAFSGAQWATLNAGPLAGATSWSVAWVGQLSTTSGDPVLFQIGYEGGFALETGLVGGNVWGLYLTGATSVASATPAYTGAHVFVVTYTSVGSLWTISIDGVAQTLTPSSSTPVSPVGSAFVSNVFGAYDQVGDLAITGSAGLFLISKNAVWDSATQAKIRANAKASWSLP